MSSLTVGSEPEIKCSNAIQLYQSLKEGKEKILLKKPSAEKEQTLGFTNLLQATTSVMGFVKRKILVNGKFSSFSIDHPLLYKYRHIQTFMGVA